MQTKDKDAFFSANILNCIYEKEKSNFFVDMELSVLNYQSIVKVASSVLPFVIVVEVYSSYKVSCLT